MRASELHKQNSMETRTENPKRKRILLFPAPLQGHLNPMLDLANILYNQGFNITILHTNFISPLSISNHRNFTFTPISSKQPEEAPITDIVAFLSLLKTDYADPFRECLAKLLEVDYKEEGVCCLISDALLHFTQTVADTLKIRRIVLRTSSPSSFLAFDAFPILLKNGYFPIQESRLDEIVPDLEPLRVKDLPSFSTPNQERLHELIACIIDQSKASSGIIWNSFEDLESASLAKVRQVLKIPNFPIGPFHKHYKPKSPTSLPRDEETTTITWLNSQQSRSVVYVSFGTLMTIGSSQFLEIANGLANSNHPFLWVVRPGSVVGSDWIGLLPDGYLNKVNGRGHIVKWAPQKEVLGHSSVGAFWTHSGWNSTLEGLSEGVPMICMPFATDQKVNARYVSHVWGIGVQFALGAKCEEIERAIREVMEEIKKSGDMQMRVDDLKAKAMLCLKEGGSSSLSLQSLVDYISSF